MMNKIDKSKAALIEGRMRDLEGYPIPLPDSSCCCFFFSSFSPLLLCWVRVHCSIYIYISSYSVSNISHLNSPPPPLFHFPSPNSCNSFNRYHFYTYIHMCTLFVPIDPPTCLPHHLPYPILHPPHLGCSTLLFSSFVEEKR
jgi:hypothetical protein